MVCMLSANLSCPSDLDSELQDFFCCLAEVLSSEMN